MCKTWRKFKKSTERASKSDDGTKPTEKPKEKRTKMGKEEVSI